MTDVVLTVISSFSEDIEPIAVVSSIMSPSTIRAICSKNIKETWTYTQGFHGQFEIDHEHDNGYILRPIFDGRMLEDEGFIVSFKIPMYHIGDKI